MPRLRIVEDENPGIERYSLLEHGSFDRVYGTNNTRIVEGRLERLPARCGPSVAADPDASAYEISSRADSWWAPVCSPQGNVLSYVLTNSRSVLGGTSVLNRSWYENQRRLKLRHFGGFVWVGDCLITLIARDELRPASLITRDQLPATACAPNPDGPCACKVREREARLARHAAIEKANLDAQNKIMNASAVETARQQAEVTAEVTANAIKQALAPVVAATRTKKGS